MSDKKVSLTVKFENLNEKDRDALIFLFKTMENFGNIGHSDSIKFYADGDGDFRPKITDENNEELKLPEYVKDEEKKYLYNSSNTIDPDCFYYMKNKLPIIKNCDDSFYYKVVYAPVEGYKYKNYIYHAGDIIGDGSGIFPAGIKEINDITIREYIPYSSVEVKDMQDV